LGRINYIVPAEASKKEPELAFRLVAKTTHGQDARAVKLI
jgi:hypothetical protein